ncbi:hypothetical protein ACIQC9_01685 [Brevundimonas sp. NPDC092305]|uniref:hypothetical protein n=1 Tax=Brevundimonas sp. NPDC092305 TaxID=3363957 RepID=UPI00380DD682
MASFTSVLALSLLTATVEQDPANLIDAGTWSAFSLDEKAALSLVRSLGDSTRLCRDYLPEGYGAEVDSMVAATRAAGAAAPVLDLAFASGYADPKPAAGRTDESTCAATLEDNGALVQGSMDVLSAIETKFSNPSGRIWSRHFTPGLVRNLAALNQPPLPDDWRRTYEPTVWIRFPRAQFPAGAYSKEASVYVRCVVTVSSTLRACEILNENPAGQGFGQAVLDALPEARLRPGSVNGSPIESHANFTVRFRVQTPVDSDVIANMARRTPAPGLATEGDAVGQLTAALELCRTAGYSVNLSVASRAISEFETKALATGWTAEDAGVVVLAGQERQRAAVGLTRGLNRQTPMRQRRIWREAHERIRDRCHEIAAQHPGSITGLEARDEDTSPAQ